ncbi:tetratricopeptide repeat protein [Lutimonas sp.]|uniref:tetratricopeptide repeat protein n=1 Tax=Lutimonas sp. TaxID=1872403 RepID=UPI003C73AA0B
MKWNKLISELKRRHVFKSTIAYLAISWIVIQIASILLPALDAPDTALKTLIYILAAGLVLWIGFSWYYDLTRDGIQKTDDTETSPESLQLANRRLNKVIAGSLTVGVLLLIVISFWAGSNWNDQPATPEIKKIAVIPLVLKTGGEEDAYLETGMTQELIDQLSKVEQLTVINQRSTKVLTSGFDQTNTLILNVIKGVDFFVDGSIEREFDRINVQIALRESIGVEPVWQKGYSSDILEVRLLWANVAADLASQMGIVVKPENQLFWSGLRPVNPKAYELYLKGRHYLNKSTLDERKQGLLYLQEAIDLNPSDPHAYAWLSEAYIMLGHNGPDAPPDAFPNALKAAERAIELDSTIALGWASLSHYHTYYGRDWAKAESAFYRANELDPNLADNHFHRSWYLAIFGEMNEAIEEHKLARDLDPFTPYQTAWLGELYRWVGMYEEGLREVERVNYMDDKFALGLFIRGRIFIDQGKVEEGLELLRQSAEIDQFWKYPGYGLALLQTGHIEEGKAILREMEQIPPNDFIDLFIGVYYAYLGDYDKSFEMWNIENETAWFVGLRIMFVPDEIRKDPRFIQLMRDMNLPDPAPLVYHPEGSASAL